MKQFTLAAGLFAVQAAAYPAVMNEVRQSAAPGSAAAKAISAARGNCGAVPCATFSEDQLVSTTGEHAYASPAAGDIRGPCPGLNAAANHGYLSRSGVTTIPETTTGLLAAYGLGPDLGSFLAAYAVLTDGDPIAGTWSIGGPQQSDPLTSGLIGPGQGISYSHNVYEGDASIGRSDAYINGGDAHSLNVERFKELYKVAVDDGTDRYTMDKVAQDFLDKSHQSESQNPYYFSAPFSGLVSPLAYNFIIAFMSNHTAENPSGYLDGNQLKQFFAVSGDYPNFTWNKGQERIPNDWYKRPLSQPYTAELMFTDFGIQELAYPGTYRLGGNTNGVNTFTGVTLDSYTNRQFPDAQTLFNSGKASCYLAQALQSAMPDFSSAALQAANALIGQYITPLAAAADCPVVDQYDQTLFNQFPGYKYSPTGPATNYKE